MKRCVVLFLCFTAWGGERIQVYFCQKTTKPPEIDGVLDDPCWKDVESFSGFILEPAMKKPAKKQTIVRMLYDERSLYFGIKLIEPDMELLRARPSPHDSAIWWQDSVEIFLDPEHEHSVGFYQFGSNVYGSRFETYSGEGDWNGFWRVAGSKGEAEWYLEVEIPFATIMTKPFGGKIIGLNVRRLQYANKKGHEWSNWSASPYGHITENYGHIILSGDFASFVGNFLNYFPEATKRPVKLRLALGYLEFVPPNRKLKSKLFRGELPPELKKVLEGAEEPTEPIEFSTSVGTLRFVPYKGYFERQLQSLRQTFVEINGLKVARDKKFSTTFAELGKKLVEFRKLLSDKRELRRVEAFEFESRLDTLQEELDKLYWTAKLTDFLARLQ